MNKQTRKIALRMIPYGVYILTSKMNSEVSAATVTWVSQASFEPPMISICIKRNSGSYKVVKKRGEFILHMLGTNQKALAATFFKPSELINGLINGEKYKMKNDLPLLTAPPAYIRCQVLEILEHGDHPLFLAEVKEVTVRKDVAPLQLCKTGWSYGG